MTANKKRRTDTEKKSLLFLIYAPTLFAKGQNSPFICLNYQSVSHFCAQDVFIICFILVLNTSTTARVHAKHLFSFHFFWQRLFCQPYTLYYHRVIPSVKFFCRIFICEFLCVNYFALLRFIKAYPSRSLRTPRYRASEAAPM